jgi:RHS repeat-associated protein
MLCAAQEELPAPFAPPMVGSDEQIFSLAAAVAVAFVFATHTGKNAASDKKPHQGIFSENRTIAVGSTWSKWQETHWDSGTWWPETVLGPTFYGYDGHGNARFMTNTAGTVGNTYQYDAFGMPIASTGSIANTYLYSGERFDSSLNLYQLRARYYNMLTGRFETMDPGKETCCALPTSRVGNIFDPASLHKYVYTVNNPVNLTDPSGRGIEEDAEFEAWLAKEEVELKKTAFELCVESEIANLSVQELFEGYSLAELTIKAIANCEAKGWIR